MKAVEKSLRVWAKNHLRLEIFDKILNFTYQNLNGNLISYPFFSNPPGPLPFYNMLQPSKICGRGGGRGGSLAPDLGRWGTCEFRWGVGRGIKKPLQEHYSLW